MFRQLRNRFMFLNMSIIAAVLFVSFLAIYIVSSNLVMSEFRQAEMTSPNLEMVWLNDFDEPSRIVIMQQREEDAGRTLANLRLTLLLTGCSMLAIAFLFNYLFANEIIRPVRESFEKQKRFIADSGHELKTPLASAVANLDVLESEILSDAPKNYNPKWTLNIHAELERMDGLIKDLLNLARLDSATDGAENLTTFDLRSVFAKVSKGFDRAIEKIDYSVDCPPADEGLRISADKKLVEQILTILLDNAIKYSDQRAGKIAVEIRKLNDKSGKVVFAIKNNGAQIPEADLPKIFDRFYRADKSRSSDGSGLGLSIAKAAANKIGAKITAASNKTWTEFKVVFANQAARKTPQEVFDKTDSSA